MAVISTGPGLGRLTPTSRPNIRLGLRGLRGLGQAPQSCPAGGAWDPGLQVCCAPPGTPPMQDPCSILNNPGFIQEQNIQIAQDIATAGPLGQSTLLALTSVPINIGNDAVYCQSNPGAKFTDSEGVAIVCPSSSHSDVTTGGQPMSTYSTAQLAAMLNAQYGGQSPKTPGNTTSTIDVANTGQGGNALDNSSPIVNGGSYTTYVANPGNSGPSSNNALSNSAATTGQSNTPNQQQIANGTNVTGNSTNAQGGAAASNAQGGAAASDVTIGGVDVTSWIETNWVLLAAGVAALLILPGLMKGGR